MVTHWCQYCATSGSSSTSVPVRLDENLTEQQSAHEKSFSSVFGIRTFGRLRSCAFGVECGAVKQTNDIGSAKAREAFVGPFFSWGGFPALTLAPIGQS